MKLIVFSIIIFCVTDRLYSRSANDFLKDVFALEDDLQEEKCSTMECQTAGEFIQTKYIVGNIIYNIMFNVI